MPSIRTAVLTDYEKMSMKVHYEDRETLLLPVHHEDRETLLPLVHHQIIAELQHGGKIDSIVCVTAVCFNLIILAVNSAVCGSVNANKNVYNLFIPVFFLVITFSINAAIFDALRSSSDTKKKLLQGLVRMYQDTGVDKYYDSSVIKNYERRYKMFESIIMSFGFMAVGVPFMGMLLNLNGRD